MSYLRSLCIIGRHNGILKDQKKVGSGRVSAQQHRWIDGNALYFNDLIQFEWFSMASI